MSKVLVAGCGNFGAWWVVGLLRDASIDLIHIYDPFFDATSIIESRLACFPEIHSSSILSKVKYTNTLQKLDKSYDLAIISSCSAARFNLFSELLDLIDSVYWVLEKVLTSSLIELAAFKKLCKGQRVFVNHSRRFQPIWLEARQAMDHLGPIKSIRQELGPWELASNSFHFVDIISWLLDARLISATVINGKWRNSSIRSAGYFDLDGSLQLTYENSIFHVITRDTSSSANKFFFSTNKNESDSTCQFLIDELSGFSDLVTGATSKITLEDWSSLVLSFTQALFISGNSLLPSFECVYSNTEILLRSFRRSWSMQFGSEGGFYLS